MKKLTKTLLLVLCALLLVAGSVLGTVAYLTSQDQVVNTFTVGKVAIKLDEAPVDANGVATSEDRVKANEYHLLPGHDYDKDPTVTVLANSEECYVRMLVTVENMAAMKVAFPKTDADFADFYGPGDVFLLQNLVTGWDSNAWTYVDCKEANGSATYEFRFYTTVAKSASNTVLPALFQNIVVPGEINNAQLAMLQDATITVEAHAIQADGFTTADAAWAAWNPVEN